MGKHFLSGWRHQKGNQLVGRRHMFRMGCQADACHVHNGSHASLVLVGDQGGDRGLWVFGQMAENVIVIYNSYGDFAFRDGIHDLPIFSVDLIARIVTNSLQKFIGYLFPFGRLTPSRPRLVEYSLLALGIANFPFPRWCGQIQERVNSSKGQLYWCCTQSSRCVQKARSNCYQEHEKAQESWLATAGSIIGWSRWRLRANSNAPASFVINTSAGVRAFSARKRFTNSVLPAVRSCTVVPVVCSKVIQNGFN